MGLLLALIDGTPVELSVSLAATDGPDIAEGSVQAVVSTVVSATDGADRVDASAQIVVSTSLSVTEGSDTALISTALVVSSALNATDGPDSLASSIALEISSSLAATDGADTANLAAALISVSSVSAVEGPDDLSSEVSISSESKTISLECVDGADLIDVDATVDGSVTGGSSQAGGVPAKIRRGGLLPLTRDQWEASRQAEIDADVAGDIKADKKLESVREDALVIEQPSPPELTLHPVKTGTSKAFGLVEQTKEIIDQPQIQVEIEDGILIDDDEMAAVAILIASRMNQYRLMFAESMDNEAA